MQENTEATTTGDMNSATGIEQVPREKRTKVYCKQCGAVRIVCEHEHENCIEHCNLCVHTIEVSEGDI